MGLLKKTILRLGFLAGLLCSLCFVGEVKAVKCSDLLSYQNQNSVAYACGKVEQYPWEARGTLWLNDSSSEYNTESWVRVSAAQMKAGGKVKIYLHGAILNGYSAYAEYIKLVKVNYTIWGNADNYSNYAPLSNVPSRMWRVGNPYPFDYDIESSVNNQVVLDAKKLLALEKNTNNCSTSGRKTTCKIRLEAFRCYQGRGTQSSSCYEDGSCYCYSDKSFLNVEIEEPEPEPALFKGQAEVYEEKNTYNKLSTGFVNTSKSAGNLVAMIGANEQSRVAKFKLSLKEVGGISGKVKYVIHRAYRPPYSGAFEDPVEKGQGELNMNASSLKDFNFSETVKPNETICYYITFTIRSNTSSAATARVCVIGSQEIDVGRYKKLDVRARNQEASAKFQSWVSDYVYAKPGDVVEFAGEYRPDIQNIYEYKKNDIIAMYKAAHPGGCGTGKYQYNCDKASTGLSMAKLDSDGNAIGNISGNIGGNSTLGSVYDSKVSPGWNNAFTVYVEDGPVKNIFGVKGSNNAYNNYSGTYGCGERESCPLGYDITYADVGKKKAARSILNQNDTTKNTPTGGYTALDYGADKINVIIETRNKTYCELGATACLEDGSFWDDGYLMSAASEKVYAIIPYNFNTKATISNVGGVVYAGEVKAIPYGTEVVNKTNALTTQHGTESEGYATVVPETKCGLEMSYDGDNWLLVEERDGGQISPQKKGNYSASLGIADAQSGSKIYLRSYVWPASSGSDDNLSVDGFTGVAYSEVVELNIAKKPSFQVWGGSLYSNGDIDLGGYISKSAASDDGSNVFGSWTELGLQVNGTVKGLASGAGLGYTRDSSGNIFPSPYGNSVNADTGSYKSIGGGKNDICYTSTLSFRNDECSEGKIGSSGISLTSKDNLVSMLDKIDDSTANATGLGLDCAEKTCNLAGGTLVTGVKAINKSDADIIITGNIYYGNGEERTLDSTNLPKLFIYANNIIIDCSVEEINAVLIADGYVDTCKTEARDGYDETHKYNHPDNSHQLKINGSVIANKLKLNRTYGAGAGVNSIVPAEIINYDPTLYVWGIRSGSGSEVGGGGLESGTYMREVAPRY